MEDTKSAVEFDHKPSETLKKAIALIGGRLAPIPDAIKDMPEPAVEVANQVMKEMVDNWQPPPFKRGCGPEVVADLKAEEPAVQPEHPTVAETLAEDALKPKDKPLTETQFRALRRAFFTVRHLVLPECGHKLDEINQPKNNCEYCWWAFFSGHGELVQVTDRAFQEQGVDFLDKMRGIKYRKMFIRYMSTLARLQKEAAELAEQEKQSAPQTGDADGNNTAGVR